MKNFKTYLNEGRPSQRHPLQGHDYHKKTDAELRYIVKDAGEAAKKMRGHDEKAENKYADQVNDASSVLHFRKNGMPDWYKKKYGHMKEENLAEMDNRTASGDRREKREYSPEAKAEKNKEQQKRLKSISPELRKKLRLPDVKEEVEQIEEERPGLWANIRAKRARGERMRKPGEKGAPTEAQIRKIKASEEVENIQEIHTPGTKVRVPHGGKTVSGKVVRHDKGDKHGSPFYVVDVGSYRSEKIPAHKVQKEEVEQIEEGTPAWQRKEGKNPEGGLNQKGVESYRRENPGSKLQTAVTTPPSKLKKGSKSAKRRLSFCRRMRGMKEKLTSAKTARDPDSRINKSLRKWNC